MLSENTTTKFINLNLNKESGKEHVNKAGENNRIAIEIDDIVFFVNKRFVRKNKNDENKIIVSVKPDWTYDAWDINNKNTNYKNISGQKIIDFYFNDIKKEV